MPVASHRGYFLGRATPRGAVPFAAVDYVALVDIKLPKVFGHAVNEDWGVLGNDNCGDCVIADISHQLMIDALATRRHRPPLTTDSTVRVYSQWTGYNPNAAPDAQGKNPTDNGTVMADAARRWNATGYPDADNVLHKSRGYAGGSGDWEETLKLIRLFGAVSLGVDLPRDAMEQFDQRVPWDIKRTHSPILGGHCITGCGLNSRGNLVAITWGRTIGITRAWYEQYVDEVVCTFSQDYLLATGQSPELIDMAKLDQDIASLPPPIG